MRVLRLLAAPLLASIWISPAVAQSGTAQSSLGQSRGAQSAPSRQYRSPFATPLPFSLQPLPGSHRFSLNPGTGTYGTGTFLFAPKPGGPGLNQTIPSLHLRRDDRFATWPNSDILFQLAPQRMQRTVIMAHNDVCYTVREYTFTRDNPKSDATRIKDYSACSPASNFHLKAAAPR